MGSRPAKRLDSIVFRPREMGLGIGCTEADAKYVIKKNLTVNFAMRITSTYTAFQSSNRDTDKPPNEIEPCNYLTS